MTQDRTAVLEQIAAQVRSCTLCDLYKGRNKAVPGAGTFTPEILFIGEGPGFYEDKQGLPFVGRSGDFLEKMLALIGYTRDQVFITNVVKCRPPENRDPLPTEIVACKPYLDTQESTLDPLVIATLGRFSMARYFPGGKITQLHGKPKFEHNRAYMPLFHPAAVLRNPGLEPQMEAAFRSIPALLDKVRQMRAASPAANAVPSDGVPSDGAAPGGDAVVTDPAPDELGAAQDQDKPTQLTLF
ncbi:MAG: uracil-DNA glycosylase [bacterium]|nr:uracil-DNA glycosylase [bacterium]